MRRAVSLFVLTVVLLSVSGQPVRAVEATPARWYTSLVPSCSETVYTLEGPGNERKKNITPAQYWDSGEFDHTTWKVVGTGTRTRCTLQDVVGLFTRAARYGLGLLGIVAVGFFIYGGFLLLISAGRSEYVSRGKSVLVGTFLGTLVVLTAFVIVNTVGLSIDYQGDLTGSAPVCRKTGPRCGDTIQGACHDPENADGTVTALQTALNGKCPQCHLDVDGCYGPQTAFCVWLFKLENGMPIAEDYRRETATPAVIAAVQSEASRACSDVNVIEPEVPDPDPSIDPIIEQGCCVTPDPDSTCLDTTNGECPFALLPSGAPRFSYSEGACDSPANAVACNRDYQCVDYRSSPPCCDVSDATAACIPGRVKQAGSCTGPFCRN